MMHVLRNPHGHSEDEVRAARLWAGDEIETLERIIREGVATQEAVRFRARAQAFSNLCDELVQFAECTCELGAPAGCTCGLKPILDRYLAMHPSPFTGEVSSV